MPASATNPLARRIKKHITSRQHEFFAVTAPRLEKVCQKELRLILPQNETFVQTGGVTFFGRPEAMYQANLHLRSATRVLMRIGAFQALNFAEFAAKMADLSLELYFTGGLLPQIAVSTHHCRLYHKGALEETAQAYFRKRFPRADAGTDAPKLYIRGVDDRFEFSLDTSGNRLYMRGLKPQGGAATLRETLAYAILRQAGYKGGPLIDPMCGSGTFSLEAGLTAARIAPGLTREFAFCQAPFFNAPQWEYLQKQARAAQKAPPPKPLIIASDKDAGACAKFETALAGHPLRDWIRVVPKDFFGLGPQTYFGQRPGLVVLNPPYGLRLLERAEAENLYGAICQKLTADFQNWRYAIVTPQKDWLSLKDPRWHKIWHGGLDLFLATGRL